MKPAPTYADVEQASRRIAGVAHRTPVMRSRTADKEIGAEIFFKCENLQRMGAFKFRGGYNALSQFTPEQRRAGAVAYSSGNHAQAIALSGQLLGIPTTIVMPSDAPKAKLAATRGYGATVVTYDRYTESRQQIATDLAESQGLTLIPPFDHPDIIAGQGTAAKELIEDVGSLDAVITPLGGGGLLSGTALSVAALLPDAFLYGVEPANGDDGLQSLRSGSIVTIEAAPTIADGAQSTALGQLTFDIIKREVDDIFLAEDDELIDVMRFFLTRMKILVEPTGCLGYAALRTHRESFAGKRIGVILSGGNVDLDLLSREKS